MSKEMRLEFFPESYIQLGREIAHHPKLVSLLQQQEANEFEIRIAVVAAYCEVMLDGLYSPKDLEKLADILLKRLQKMPRGDSGILVIH
jgi:hypothetical protein